MWSYKILLENIYLNHETLKFQSKILTANLEDIVLHNSNNEINNLTIFKQKLINFSAIEIIVVQLARMFNDEWDECLLRME